MTLAQGQGVAVAGASLYPAGSLKDAGLSRQLAQYRATVASRYRALRPADLEALPAGPLSIMPKVDGELWFAVCTAGDVALVAPTGRVLEGSIPVLDELRKGPGARAGEGTIVAGELFALGGPGRPRVGGVSRALGTDGDPARLGFMAFDVVHAPGGAAPPDAWADRRALLGTWFEGGKRAQAIPCEEGTGKVDVEAHFASWVESGKAEGLVVRRVDGRIFKIKPALRIDCAVVGFTEREGGHGQVRSLLLSLLRPDGTFQLVGALGNVGSDADRTALHSRLAGAVVPSEYRTVSSSGAMYRYVRPEVVVEVDCTDLQTEDAEGLPVRQWALRLQDSGWSRVCPVAGASLLHPGLVRIRDDKTVSLPDVRVEQLLERVEVPDLQETLATEELPPSVLVRREVYTRDVKGELSVRKLLVWKTNKDEITPDFPAYVVHWTDYSPGRKQPLQREVRQAPTLDDAQAIAEAMLEKGVRKGWVRAPEAAAV